MDYKKLSLPLIVLSTVLFVQHAAGDEPLSHVCTIKEKFTANSEYDKILRILLDDLHYKTPATGYHYESVRGKNNDTVYGSALCRVDVSQADCRACVFEATKGIGQICPNNLGANVYYKHCFLEYSNFPEYPNSNSFGYPVFVGYYLKGEYDPNIPAPQSTVAEIKKFLNELLHQKTCSLNELQRLKIRYWMAKDWFSIAWI